MGVPSWRPQNRDAAMGIPQWGPRDGNAPMGILQWGPKTDTHSPAMRTLQWGSALGPHDGDPITLWCPCDGHGAV